jgi:hypothetical protein
VKEGVDVEVEQRMGMWMGWVRIGEGLSSTEDTLPPSVQTQPLPSKNKHRARRSIWEAGWTVTALDSGRDSICIPGVSWVSPFALY